MTDAFQVVLLLLLTQSTSSTPPRTNELILGSFKVKLGSESIYAVLDDPSRDSAQNEDSTGTLDPPIELGVQLSNHGIDLNIAEDLGNNKIGFGDVTLELKNSDEEERCMEVTWLSAQNATLEDCFKMSPYNWYGGPEQLDQYWPIEPATFKEYAYVAKEWGNGAIAEPYWFNSNGLMIYVDPTVPLFLDQNHHREDALCLFATHASPYHRTTAGPTLKYTVCKFDNPRTAHEYAIKTFLGKPSNIPDVRMVQHPVWSTWVKFKFDIDDDVILRYAKAINEHGFKNSHLEIDDLWETCYGSLSFNKTRFPNMKRLTGELNKLGFRTTIWVHPFINLDCDLHSEAATKGYFAKNVEGDIQTEWWDGKGSVIDFTNPAAESWYETRLHNMLIESGIDSLKFDAGESSWAPQVTVLNGPESEHPEILCRKYVELAAKFGPMVEVRTGKRTQNLPMFIRMIDRDSKWGYMHRGMHSVITTTFVFNMHGYPFVLPDMVGGNGYEGDVITKEMYIRFLQLNVFLPAIQFSIPPWDFDSETVEITKKYTTLHYQYADKIVELMRKAVKTGHPINPPIWWVDPTDQNAHSINSEYMLGEDVLVAPVLERGAIKRDIYLPRGQWRDEAKPDKPVWTGPTWLRNYPAPLNTLPYFTRVSSSAGQFPFSILLCVGIACLLNVIW